MSHDRLGIVLAGGAGTRLDPLTRIVCKQLLPIYDKPMVYYPLSTLMLGGFRRILIISTPKDLPQFRNLFGDGSHLGMEFLYEAQPEPKGIAQAFLIAAPYLTEAGTALILGDNIFHGKLDFFRRALRQESGACIFAYQVKDPERYGVIEFDESGRALSIEEKPEVPRSHFAVPGLYVYDGDVLEVTRGLKPSARGELEITDVNRAYLDAGTLRVEPLGRGVAWLDTGTPESLLEASTYIATLEHRQGLKVACLEEIAHLMGFIDDEGLGKTIGALPKNAYRAYLEAVLADRI